MDATHVSLLPSMSPSLTRGPIEPLSPGAPLIPLGPLGPCVTKRSVETKFKHSEAENICERKSINI